MTNTACARFLDGLQSATTFDWNAYNDWLFANHVRLRERRLTEGVPADEVAAWCRVQFVSETSK